MKGYLFSHLSWQFSSMHRRSVSISIGKWSNVIYTFTLNRCFPTTANRTRLSIGLHTQTERERARERAYAYERVDIVGENGKENRFVHTHLYILTEKKKEMSAHSFISFHFEATDRNNENVHRAKDVSRHGSSLDLIHFCCDAAALLVVIRDIPDWPLASSIDPHVIMDTRRTTNRNNWRFEHREIKNSSFNTTLIVLGRLLLILQLLSFLSVLLADLHGVLWFIIVLRYRHSTASFPLLLSLLVVTVFAYLTLSMMIYLVWQTSKDYVHLIHISYSFYLVLAIVFSHSLTLISLTINLAQYRTSHRSIQPYGKVLLAFNQPIASATPWFRACLLLYFILSRCVDLRNKAETIEWLSPYVNIRPV